MAIDPITTALDLGTKIIERLWPDPTQQNDAKLKLLELQQTGELAKLTADTDLAKAQALIDEAEAHSTSMFIAGWRPAVGWVCAVAFAYHYILQPLLAFILAVCNIQIILPAFDSVNMMTVLMGMLGLGAYRTVEKLSIGQRGRQP